MTDRYISLTVILDKQIRSEDAQPLIDAIKMLKGVAAVRPFIADPSIMFAEMAARNELRDKILEIFFPKVK